MKLLHKLSIIVLILCFSLQVNGQSAEALANLAEKCYQNKRYDDAITLALEALDKDKKNELATWVCAVSYYNVEFYSEAIRYKNKLIKLKPNISAYHSNLGGLYGILGYDSIAIAYCNKAIEINPDDLSGISNRAAVHCFQNRIDEALNDLNYVIEREPLRIQDIQNLSVLYYRLENYEESLKMATKLHSLGNPKGNIILFIEETKAKVDTNYHSPKDTIKLAINLLTESLKKNRWDSASTLSRGKGYDMLGNKELARKDYLQGIAFLNDILTDTPKAWTKRLSRADAYKRLGEKEKAIADYRIVLQDNPTQEKAKKELEELEQK